MIQSTRRYQDQVWTALRLTTIVLLLAILSSAISEETCNEDDATDSQSTSRRQQQNSDDSGGSVWKIPDNVKKKARVSARRSKRGHGTKIVSHAISDVSLLEALTDHREWFACYENTRGSHTHWMDWDAQPRNLFERVAVHLWRDEPLIQGQKVAGYEIWCNILTPEGPLVWHIDKDQVHFKETGEVKLPFYGSVFYGYPHDFQGGFLELTRYDSDNDKPNYEPDDIERIAADYNRWVVFNASKFHRVSPVTKGTRLTLAINLWKERPRVAYLE